MFDGEVRYAKDAFEGLALMDAVMAVNVRGPMQMARAVLPLWGDGGGRGRARPELRA